MISTGNNLQDRISELAEYLKTKHPLGWETSSRKLLKISNFVDEGGIIGQPEFDFLDTIKPRILGKCESISPLGHCQQGVMEWCRHRGEWELGKCTCKKYHERARP